MWHAHAEGQFILVETGTSHLYTEAGAWIVPARRVAWVPPGLPHASRSSGGGSGWVLPGGNRLLAVSKGGQFPGGGAVEGTPSDRHE